MSPAKYVVVLHCLALFVFSLLHTNPLKAQKIEEVNLSHRFVALRGEGDTVIISGNYYWVSGFDYLRRVSDYDNCIYKRDTLIDNNTFQCQGENVLTTSFTHFTPVGGGPNYGGLAADAVAIKVLPTRSGQYKISWTQNYITYPASCNPGETTTRHFTAYVSVTPTRRTIRHFHQLPQNPLFSTPQLLSKDKSAPYQVCADGSLASTFTISGGDIDYYSISVRIPEDRFTSDTTSYGRFNMLHQSRDSMVIQYRHPNYMAPYAAQKVFSVELSNGSGLVDQFQIRAVRAPVVMMHGIWSDSSSFRQMENNFLESGLYSKNQLRRIDYKKTNNRPFVENQIFVPINIDSLLTALTKIGIAAGKVDFIGHSMGGILGRLYLQSDDNVYHHDLRKLITLNTPHGGSELANLLTSAPAAIKDALCNQTLRENLNNSGCDDGGATDLRVDSPAIRANLNGDRLNYRIVPSHTIVSTEDLLPRNTIIGILSKHPTWRMFNLLLDFGLYQVFDDAHDLIVGLSSQRGGMTGPYTSLIQHQMHVGSPANTNLINRVKELLQEKPSSSYFSLYGFHPPRLSSVFTKSFNSVAGGSSTVTAGEVHITSPRKGQVFAANEPVTIAIAGTNLDTLRTIVSYSADSIYMAKQSGSEATHTLIADGNQPGKKAIVVVGQTSTGEYIADSTYFYVGDIHCESLQSGNWTASSTWSCGHEPTINDIVTINPGHIISLSTSTNQALQVINNGTITYTTPGAKLFIKGGD